jgi:uncharacterized protein (DUF4415 family)
LRKSKPESAESAEIPGLRSGPYLGAKGGPERQPLMKKVSTKPNSAGRRLKISDETQALYKKRASSLDNDPDTPVLPPEMWQNAAIGKYYRPLKTPVSVRIDNDVLAWLRSKGEGHISRINGILRERMEQETRH